MVDFRTICPKKMRGNSRFFAGKNDPMYTLIWRHDFVNALTSGVIPLPFLHISKQKSVEFAVINNDTLKNILPPVNKAIATATIERMKMRFTITETLDAPPQTNKHRTETSITTSDVRIVTARCLDKTIHSAFMTSRHRYSLKYSLLV